MCGFLKFLKLKKLIVLNLTVPRIFFTSQLATVFWLILFAYIFQALRLGTWFSLNSQLKLDTSLFQYKILHKVLYCS